ncbi:hypothetical protein K9L63_01145 [Candidatus Gracilibacteria bacterium]|nr:hypothetical protein [Candidatus Gracilibacteria bacterium]
MKLIHKKHALQALKQFILFSAIIHLFSLSLFSIIKRDGTLLNYFDILDIDLFFPFVGEGIGSQVLSFVVAIIVYFVLYCVCSYKK